MRIVLGHAALAAVLVAAWAGCAAKPTASPPSAVAEAARLANQATRLQAEENWAGAAAWWARAGRQFQLLNQLTNVAVALHNEGVARRALGERDAAVVALERASRLNAELGQGDAWWRDQIVLLQLENDGGAGDSRRRMTELEGRTDWPADPRLRALLEHERARMFLGEGRPPEALAAAERATQGYAESTDPAGVAAATMTRARALAEMERWGESAAAWEDSLAKFETLGKPRGIALALAGLGSCLAAEGRDVERAQDLIRRARENLVALGMSTEARALEIELERER